MTPDRIIGDDGEFDPQIQGLLVDSLGVSETARAYSEQSKAHERLMRALMYQMQEMNAPGVSPLYVSLGSKNGVLSAIPCEFKEADRQEGSTLILPLGQQVSKDKYWVRYEASHILVRQEGFYLVKDPTFDKLYIEDIDIDTATDPLGGHKFSLQYHLKQANTDKLKDVSIGPTKQDPQAMMLAFGRSWLEPTDPGHEVPFTQALKRLDDQEAVELIKKMQERYRNRLLSLAEEKRERIQAVSEIVEQEISVDDLVKGKKRGGRNFLLRILERR